MVKFSKIYDRKKKHSHLLCKYNLINLLFLCIVHIFIDNISTGSFSWVS